MVALDNYTLWEQKLAERYILDPALEMGWEYMEWYGQPGWSYPLFNADGQVWKLDDGRDARRWKAIDPAAPYRYMWGYPDMGKDDKKKPDHCDYYWTYKPARGFIANAQGTLHIACGEPDMLTLMAMGFYNVTSFFGEGNIPHNFISNMNSLGVKRIIYYPDTDAAGFAAAQKLHDTLYNTGIEFICKRLPVPENGDKQDLNSLLQAVEGKRQVLHTMFADLPIHRFVAPQSTADEPKQTKRKDFDRVGYDAALERFYTEIENALGVQKYGKDGFSQYVNCIFTTHEQDQRKPRGTWHKDNHTFTCFKCGQTWKGDDVAGQLGIPLVQWQDYMPKGEKQAPDEPPPVYSSDDALNRYRERLLGLHVSSVPPVPFPFSTLHHLEGFARLMKPRKLTAVLGLSGGGKTSFMEVAGDNLRRSGIDILWWGPEWSWEEMADRAVQRYGGLTMTEMMLHETALSEARAEANGKPATHFGSQINDNDPRYKKTLATLDMIMGWYGKSFYIDKMGLNLSTLLDTMQSTIDEKRKLGRDIRVCVFDYVQLLQVSGAVGEMERINRAVSMIKTFCVDTNMIGVISTQPRKNDSSKAKENQDGVEFNPTLASESAKFLVDHEFNLFITLNPVYMNGQLTDKGVLSITKNSGGRTGSVPVYIDFRHLAWLDKRLSTRDEANLKQTVNLDNL